MSPEPAAVRYCLTPYGRAMVEANLGLAWAIVARTTIAGRREPEDRQQMAYLALIEAVAHYDGRPGNEFSTYAWTTIKNVLRDWAREDGLIRLPRHAASGSSGVRAKAARARRIGPLPPWLAGRTAPAPVEVERAEDGATIRTAIAALPEPYRRVIAARYAGMRAGAIGRQLGRSLEAVKGVERVGHRRLRPLLARLADGS